MPRGPHPKIVSSQSATTQSQTTPNVLFLAVDDMKDWVGCLGGYEGQVLTPNIDSTCQTRHTIS